MNKTKSNVFDWLPKYKLKCSILFISETSFSATKQFPEHFLLGTATGAYQVEGAWNEGKNPINELVDFFILYLK